MNNQKNNLYSPTPMRRSDRSMPAGDVEELLNKAEYGVLSTVDADGNPYGVPLSFVKIANSIYFHCAKAGHKLDNIAHNSRVSFCVVGDVNAFFTNNFTTAYRSVIVFGAARFVTDNNEKHQCLSALCKKYLPDHMDKADAAIEKSLSATEVVAIDILGISGKQNLIKPS